MTETSLSTEESVTRRLSSLQRRLTQALGDPDPIVSVTERLKSICNATVALIDRRGAALTTTGPVPLTLLFGDITRTTADTQMIDTDGWHGVADRVIDPSQGGEHAGWLIVATRRANFPDAYSIAATHVAAALVEASLRMTTVAQQQIRAIQASVLEEALALQRQPYDSELAGRIASFNLSFDEELRVVVFQARRGKPGARGPDAADLSVRVDRSLKGAGISRLMSVRDQTIIVMAQCTPATLNRVLVADGLDLSNVLTGVGRAVTTLGGIADSYQDAHLAIRTLGRRGPGPSSMAFEDLDFATRLFAEVGVERVAAWARQFVGPIMERPPLAEGLQAFLAHDQNIMAAADSLNIHHNSLRYRLTKVEELLKVSLRQPSAISSLFLALAAIDFEQENAALPRATRPSGRRRQVLDIDAPLSTGYPTPVAENVGVVRG